MREPDSESRVDSAKTHDEDGGAADSEPSAKDAGGDPEADAGGSGGTSGTSPDGGAEEPGAEDARIDSVWLAQTHVLRADDPLLTLVGSRNALLKVAVVSESAGRAPPVRATLRVGEERTTVTLEGPSDLPTAVPSQPGVVVHRYEDSFTALLPGEWIRPSLRIEIKAGNKVTEVAPKVGAPTVVHMTMFDVHYFGQSVGQDYPAGWQEQLSAKWPVAQLEVQRVPSLTFGTLVVPQREGLPALKVSSREEYKVKTGEPFDGEQEAALAWVSALSRAGGQSDLSLYFVNIYGVSAGGEAGAFEGVGSGTSLSVLHHELGHALSLPHWGDDESYPYKGAMYGIAAPDTDRGTHAGPTWAFDLPSGTFIAPTVQPGNVGGRAVGTYKADPMQGGGTGDQEPAFLLRHFSDYSVDRMRSYLEDKVVVYDAEQKTYASWDAEAGRYGKTRASNGVNYPLEHDVEVISVLASMSMADPDPNLVYPPIGPYRSGLIRTFDPSLPADRELAAQGFCPPGGCDYSLRVVQGEISRTYLLPASGSASDDKLARSSLATAALNLRAADGQVTRAEVLATPDAQQLGLPASPTVLSRWPAL